MSDFKAKMHKIRFPLGLPDPAGGSLRRSPRPPSCIYWAYTSKRRAGKREGRGRGEKRKGKGKGGGSEGMGR